MTNIENCHVWSPASSEDILLRSDLKQGGCLRCIVLGRTKPQKLVVQRGCLKHIYCIILLYLGSVVLHTLPQTPHSAVSTYVHAQASDTHPTYPLVLRLWYHVIRSWVEINPKSKLSRWGIPHAYIGHITFVHRRCGTSFRSLIHQTPVCAVQH